MPLNKFSEEQIINRIRLENPWWTTNIVDEFFQNMRPRTYFHLFYPLVKEKKVKRAVVLMGPRRAGKTVMIFQTIQKLIQSGVHPKKIAYLSVETPIYNNIGLEQLFEFCRKAVGQKSPDGFFIFFDEIQYLRNWELHLKSLVDIFHRTRFIASGSAATALKLKSDESGTGRFTDFMLPPLTFNEFIDLKGRNQYIVPIEKDWKGSKTRFFETIDIQKFNRFFEDYINFGGYPEVIFSKEIQMNPGRYIRNDIVDKVLLRDLPSLYGIRNLQELNSLFNVIAYNTANEFSYKALSVNSGVDELTLRKYIEYLEAAFLIKVVYRVNQNAKRFKRANFFKIYLTNPSLRSALFTPVAGTEDFMGNLVETAIFAQWFHRSKDQLHYARWQNGEVDIVGLSPTQQPRFAVEVKWSNRFFTNPTRLKNLVDFCKKTGIKRAMVTTLDQSGEKTIDGIELDFEPASLYCYTVGKNALDRKMILS